MCWTLVFLNLIPPNFRPLAEDALAMAVKEAIGNKKVIFLPVAGGDEFLPDDVKRWKRNTNQLAVLQNTQENIGQVHPFEDAGVD